MKIVRIARAMFNLVVVLLMFAPVLSAADPQMVEAAKKEQEVVWYTTTNLEPAKRIIDLFQKKYPFLRVNLYRTNTGPLTSRVLLEARAGKNEWDVLSGGGEIYPPVFEKGLIAQYR